MADDRPSLEELQGILQALYAALREPSAQRLGSTEVDGLASDIEGKLSELETLIASLRDAEHGDPAAGDAAGIAQRYRHIMKVDQAERSYAAELKARADALQHELPSTSDASALLKRIQEILRSFQ